MAEASALGATQAAAGIAASFDKTGIASIPVALGGVAARKAWMASGRARMQAAREADKQAFYKKYGMNPDGTPSGRPGPGSAVQE
jgi:hypothetical protein